MTIMKKKMEIENDSNYTYDTTKVFGDKINSSKEKIMLTSVRCCLVSGYVPREDMGDNQLEYNKMATIDDCHTEFGKNFSHMNSHHNVFQLNNPSDKSYCGLFLSKSSISKFMSNKSIIDDDLMAFIVMLLNGDVAYDLLHNNCTITHNACFGYPNNDDELNPHQNFQFQDDFKIMKKIQLQ